MSRLATSFVLGYHGCDGAIADRLISGATSLTTSKQPYDWLGPGAYFWEADPHRALEWAQWRVSRKDYSSAAVVGAAIDLGNCLDLSNRGNLKIVRGAFESFALQQKASGLPMPENKSVPGQPDQDRILRFLDCAVFQHLHNELEEARKAGAPVEPFDTVRGVFTEGSPLYDGCGFFERTHVQIAVYDPKKSIIGLFKPLRL